MKKILLISVVVFALGCKKSDLDKSDKNAEYISGSYSINSFIQTDFDTLGNVIRDTVILNAGILEFKHYTDKDANYGLDYLKFNYKLARQSSLLGYFVSNGVAELISDNYYLSWKSDAMDRRIFFWGVNTQGNYYHKSVNINKSKNLSIITYIVERAVTTPTAVTYSSREIFNITKL